MQILFKAYGEILFALLINQNIFQQPGKRDRRYFDRSFLQQVEYSDLPKVGMLSISYLMPRGFLFQSNMGHAKWSYLVYLYVG